MGYTQYLRALLEPLGIYTFAPESFSGGELVAEGEAMDALEALLDASLEDAIPLSASEAGLARWEALMGVKSAAPTLTDRREACAALLRIGGGSFTLAGLNDAIRGCGVVAEVTELGAGQVEVSFPGTRGEPADFETMRVVIERILPCHLDVAYHFFYLLWQELETLTWNEVEACTWDELEVLALP